MSDDAKKHVHWFGEWQRGRLVRRRAYLYAGERCEEGCPFRPAVVVSAETRLTKSPAPPSYGAAGGA